ncbi:cyclin-like F-box domain containing protein [Klebsormidium nitens]|uniref:Cyclin-like F-box domain containing protein n=1 Tax=Klebsormidium nitens TaxID=105231 RepID=A0A1Y1HU22_KLENI|nr:cyclin-like F-box domain containing protein [Klebsormidium nitens]|eukprot:GAQ80679.1 cyclin-like F-box domain containing protein [Klebsormidium nitens]
MSPAFAVQPPIDTKGCLIEQLVPEVLSYLLSYLDHQSLCSVSMTSATMRVLANDDRVWKHLFHVDFTTEQDRLQPPSGWKVHYSATKAVTEANQRFYSVFSSKSLFAMAGLWLNADYVKCIHPGGVLLTGYDAVIASWRVVFGWGQRYDFDLRDVRCRVDGRMAWVTLKEFVNQAEEPLIATNCFEKHGGVWHIVHHHSSPQFAATGPEWGHYR